jgi:hypothetical protein
VVNIKERKSSAYDATPTQSQKHTSHLEVVEDWDTFRHFVKIIQIVGELIVKDEHYEDVLKKQIQANFLHRNRTASVDSSSAVHALHSIDQQSQLNLLSVFSFKEYLLEDAERLKLNTLISIMESGRNKNLFDIQCYDYILMSYSQYFLEFFLDLFSRLLNNNKVLRNQ